MKVLINDNMTSCTGCYACMNSCPKDCISLVYDREGFVYPKIDKAKCVSCGKCRKICPVNNDMRENAIIATYSGAHKDKSVLLKSTSGGIFTALSQIIIGKQGVVFGAQFSDDQNRIFFSSADNLNDIDKYRVSKYYQAETGKSYSQAKEILESGRFVLYTGTPCQIAGLKAFLQKDYPNLFTMDFLCHGVASRTAFLKYRSDTEKAENAKMTDYCFREKSEKNGFAARKCSYVLGGEKHIESQFKNDYSMMFASSIINRKSCSTCAYSSIKRTSDITVADKIFDLSPEEKIYGSSFIMVNSSKGAELFDSAKEFLSIKPEGMNYLVEHCAHLREPAPSNRYRKPFFRKLKHSTFASCVEMTDTGTFTEKVKMKLDSIFNK